MREFGCVPAKRLVEQDVQRGTGQPFFAADDVADAHVVVVDDVGEVVGRQAVGFHENLVVEHVGRNADFAADLVLHQYITGGFGHLKTHGVGVAVGFELRHFFRR